MTTFEKMLNNVYYGGMFRGWREGKHAKGHRKSKQWYNTVRAKRRAAKIARIINRPHK